MFASNNQDNKSVRHLESQLFLCFNFFCSSPCFSLMSGHRASPLIHRLRSVPLWTWRHVRWVDQSKTCQWRPQLESERHHCIKKNISIMNWTRTTCNIRSVFHWFSEITNLSFSIDWPWGDRKRGNYTKYYGSRGLLSFLLYYSVAARLRHYATYIWLKNKEEKTSEPGTIVTKGCVKCNFKTRSERNKTPHLKTKPQTLSVFPNTLNEEVKESHTSDTTLIATELENSDLV